MTNENVLAPAPTRSDDQILLFAAWVSIEKSNFVLDLQRKQKNLIFQISMDILQNTNFFKAFTASASLDEDWFRLDANLLREALEITPIDQAHKCMPPHSSNAIMDFMNQLGYLGEIHFVSRMAVNNLYQPWRAILSMINNCLIAEKEGGKKKTTPKADKPMKAAPAKQAKPATTKQPKLKPVKEKSTKPTLLLKAIKGEEYDLERAIQMSLKSYQAHGQAHVGGRRTPATEEASTEPSTQPQDDTSTNIVCETPSNADAETVTDTNKTAELDEGQAGSNPGQTLESRPPPDDDKMDEDQDRSDPRKSHVALAGPNPDPMHDDVVATVYPKSA
uniref:Uncharacterized protein n=1 Tax=Tanacetum cinerariifolium TaxID=118510 RepID=A0A6L2MM66_TANCI|nr:hypothetical protein [Tanacetum cinerariifolium]